MAVIAEPVSIDIAHSEDVIGTICAEITPEPGKPSGTVQPPPKRLSLEEQELFFRNSRNFCE